MVELQQPDADLAHHQAESRKRRKAVRPRRGHPLETLQGQRRVPQRERAKTKKQQSEEIE